MKKALLLMAVLLGLTTACANSKKVNPSESIDINDYAQPNMGELGDFNLLGPADNMIVEGLNEFTWEPSINAEKYTLEISSSEYFIPHD